MIGDFGDRSARNRESKVADYTPEKWKKFAFAREAFATKAIEDGWRKSRDPPDTHFS